VRWYLVVQDNSGEGRKEASGTSEVDRLFREMSEVNPPRKVELPDEDFSGDGAGEFGEAGERIKLSDLQVADRRLNPDLSENKKMPYLNYLQMGRTFPDVYNPLFRILTKYVIKRTGKPVAEAMALVNTALSISIDGEGRIDEIALAKGLAEIKGEQEKAKLP